MINRVTKNDTANGPGIRVTVWFQGCPHHCTGCHNPETWNPDKGKPLTNELIEKILNEVDKPWVAGLTMSGGDPLAPYNLSDAIKLAQKFRERFKDTKTIWLWTGYSHYECLKKDRYEIYKYLDVLIDGRFLEEQKDPRLKYAGSKNQRVIDIKQTLKKGFTLWQEDHLNVARTMTPQQSPSLFDQLKTQLATISLQLKKWLSHLSGVTSSE